MERKKAFTGAYFLVLGIFIAKFIGALFRIPLTNIVGAEGMGLYQLIFPIYSLILSSSSGALPVAISIIISKYDAMGQPERGKKILRAAFCALFMMGILLAAGLVAISYPLALLQQNPSLRYGYYAIAPAIVFVSCIACMRGYFQGKHNMVPSAVSQITEASVKLALGLGAAAFFMRYGVEFAIWAAIGATTVSEIVTFFFLYFMYRRKEGRIGLHFKFSEARSIYKEVLQISIPMTIGGIILPISQFIDSVLVVTMLTRFGATAAQATAQYGIFSGPVSSLINLPVVAVLALGTAIIPQLNHIKIQHDIKAIKAKSDMTLKLALAIGVPAGIVFFALAEGVINLLYPSFSASEASLAALLLRIGAVSIIALSVVQIYTSLLQALGYVYKPVVNMAIAVGIKIVLIFALLPFYGIAGVAVASMVCFLSAMVLNIMTYVRLTGASPDLIKKGAVIFGCSVIMAVAMIGLTRLMRGRTALILSLLLGGVIYILALLLLGAFSDDELKSLPAGNFLFKLKSAVRRG
jgi:stage V sporulation protein B